MVASLNGHIETPMMDGFTDGDIQKVIDLKLVSRRGKPDEISEAVLWMCSDLGGFIHRYRDRYGRWLLLPSGQSRNDRLHRNQPLLSG